MESIIWLLGEKVQGGLKIFCSMLSLLLASVWSPVNGVLVFAVPQPTTESLIF